MKLLVCGGRDYLDRKALFSILDMMNYDGDHGNLISEIVQGGARGADRLAKEWAEVRGVRMTEFPAKWNLYGKRAGYIRNVEMADYRPDRVLAFPGGKGTAMMIKIAKERNIPVTIIQ